MMRLPTEMLQQMGDYLDLTSVLNLSSTNWQHRVALRPLLFRDMRIKFSSPASLDFEARRSSELLTTSESFRHVQSLRVTSALPCPPPSPTLEDCGDHPLETWKYCSIDDRTTQLVTRDDEWQNLLSLIKSLPALRKLTWGRAETIPPCILRYIENTLHQCQIYLTNLVFHSLVQSSNALIRIDPQELELATSPCIYGVVMHCDHMDSPGWVNYSKQAVIDMVAGAAPNIQHVSLHFAVGCGGPSLDTPVLNVSAKAEKGALHSLELVERDLGQSLRLWSTKTDFKVLRSFKVHSYLRASDFRWLAENCQFLSLQTLVIRLAADDDGEEAVVEMEDAVVDFLSSLPPLRSVKLTGQYTQRVVDTVLDRCGRTLRQLLLGSPYDLTLGVFASVSVSHAIRDKCPLIEELALPMMRSQGSADEVAIYRSLGEITSVHKLRLCIYCSQPFLWVEDQSMSLDYRLENGEEDLADQVCHAAMDLAIDDTLAASILQAIVTGRGSTPSSLESLDLRVDALKDLGSFWSASDIIQMLQYIGRSWTCTRKFGGSSTHQYHIAEHDPKDKFRRRAMDIFDEELESLIKEPMFRVWPEGRSGGWEKVWHSFPLETLVAT
ncbi:hypothetical protein D6D13_07586 [Aureobasidium pullulans]|uniref:F-box domain-containing protein n=1 Tax=Aureobasidium pullulans TaxID=5580 RepID=A0A4S9CA69_AURPU|nr:hypothetical protein D6D13_07586 [Aureobasidium pullulans]